MSPLWAASGSTAASFLDIPVGAAPASLGAAYTALADDAYAPVYNPAGLAHVTAAQFSGTHLSYLDSINYEFASAAIPLGNINDPIHGGLGASIQYLNTGNITGMDHFGNPTGDFSAHYTAANLSYGQTFKKIWGFGVTGKALGSSIDSVSGHAYAADIGTMVKFQSHWNAAFTVANVGSHMSSINQSEPLPSSFHLGTAYIPSQHWLLAVEGVVPVHDAAGLRLGWQWSPADVIQMRVGYRTDAQKGIPGLTGLSAGIGFRLWQQEIAYAWMPYGDLGNTHYFSFLFHLSQGSTGAKHDVLTMKMENHQ